MILKNSIKLILCAALFGAPLFAEPTESAKPKRTISEAAKCRKLKNLLETQKYDAKQIAAYLGSLIGGKLLDKTIINPLMEKVGLIENYEQEIPESIKNDQQKELLLKTLKLVYLDAQIVGEKIMFKSYQSLVQLASIASTIRLYQTHLSKQGVSIPSTLALYTFGGFLSPILYVLANAYLLSSALTNVLDGYEAEMIPAFVKPEFDALAKEYKDNNGEIKMTLSKRIAFITKVLEEINTELGAE